MKAALTDLGTRIEDCTTKMWGDRNAVRMIGRSASLAAAQEKLLRFAQIDRPVLLTGESGVGKELFARSLYALGSRRGRPYLSINCAQYQNDDLLVSEIFGHIKGSFTGATSDRSGLFEVVDGGVLFLDEVGELSSRAQAMLLRALSEGEIKPLGGSHIRRVDVRIIAATNRPLRRMIAEGTFREDLYYRLRCLHVHVPPIRERDNDWHLLVNYFLSKSNATHPSTKQFTSAAWSLLSRYAWPGNVREIQSIVDVGFCLSDGASIEPKYICEALEEGIATLSKSEDSVSGIATSLYAHMLEEGEDFWQVVREPFMDRELNRSQVRAIVRCGLRDAEGSYKRMLDLFRVEQSDYLKFMDFLRHHRLKPDTSHRMST